MSVRGSSLYNQQNLNQKVKGIGRQSNSDCLLISPDECYECCNRSHQNNSNPIKSCIFFSRMQNELEVGRFFEVLPVFMTEFGRRKNMFDLLKKQFSENVRLSDGVDGETITFGEKKLG